MFIVFFCFSNRSVCTKKGVHLRYGGITGGGVFFGVCVSFFILYLGIIPRQNSLNCFFVFTFFTRVLKSSRLILINKLKGNVIRAVACVGCCFCFFMVDFEICIT